MLRTRYLALCAILGMTAALTGCSKHHDAASQPSGPKNYDSYTNILVNSDMERQEKDGWVGEASDLSYEAGAGVTGSQGLLVTGEEDYSGAKQDITKSFTRGKSFYIEASYKSKDSSKRTTSVTLELKCYDPDGTAPDDGYVWIGLDKKETFDDSGFVKVTGILDAKTISDSTKLEITAAKIIFQTSDGTKPFYVDNCVMRDLNPEVKVPEPYNPAPPPAEFPVYAPAPDSNAANFVKYNPYQGYANWLKGPTHVHTKAHEEGVGTTPEKMAQWYKDHGYDFVCLTDHDKYTPGSAVTGILYVPAEEVSTSDGDANVFGITETLRPGLPRQFTINDAYQHGKAFTQFNHPLDSAVADLGKIKEHLDSLTNLWAIEIYNGGRRSDDPTQYWDYVLTQGKYIWATAGEDAHSMDRIIDGDLEVGRCWIMVNTQEKTVADILKNMAIGNFYATTGPDMDVKVVGNTITVKTTTGSRITWYMNKGTAIKTTSLSEGTTSDTYTLNNTEGYVRVVVKDANGKKAWSQPIFTKKQVLAPDPQPNEDNLLTNPDMESGTDGWVTEDATITEDTTVKHGGQMSLKVTERASADANIKQELKDIVGPRGRGVTYYVEAYVQAGAGASDEAMLRLEIKTYPAGTTDNSKYITIDSDPTAINDAGFTKLSGELTANWDDNYDFAKARIKVVTKDSACDFYVDDFVFKVKQ